MFFLALGHGMMALLTYHVGSDMNPILSVLTTDSGSRISAIPFQAFGLGALLILFVMAVTSHDFWLANLSAPVWKSLHMMVYGAYLLLVAHVVFGALQSEGALLYVVLISLGVVLVGGLHLIAGWRGAGIDRSVEKEVEDGFVSVCRVSELEENIPSGFLVGGERVAVLLYEGNKVNCVSGVCQHQNGPLAEGRFVYGCLTCPWHGYQYRPVDGTSPEPFTEKIPTFDVRILSGVVWVRTTPNKAGTLAEPAMVHNRSGGTHE
jgi:methionine sulfoxide reductase heme-binding subunit